MIEHLASRGEHDQFDPITAVALAKLREESGKLMEAADLYRHLAEGRDVRNHFVYNLEAARLLGLAGAKKNLVETYFHRAEELAEGGDQMALLTQIRQA